VLFSSAELAQYINDRFEPVWESVRPVPMLTIDFGNGKTVTRTLHGNIATYLCDREGNVLDIVPGIYTPDGYRQRLEQFVLLNEFVTRQLRTVAEKGQQPSAADARKASEVVRAYHQRQAELLKANQPPNVFVVRPDPSKDRIESPIKLVAAVDAAKDARPEKNVKPAKPATKADEIAGWEVLAEDTRLNESVRRQQIHRKLAETGSVKPNQIVKWLYKEVLHADLDDPYLGLGEALFRNYPFAEEEARTSRP
jgi:hypothetical protein